LACEKANYSLKSIISIKVILASFGLILQLVGLIILKWSINSLSHNLTLLFSSSSMLSFLHYAFSCFLKPLLFISLVIFFYLFNLSPCLNPISKFSHSYNNMEESFNSFFTSSSFPIQTKCMPNIFFWV
jgi:hypothetical protein